MSYIVITSILGIQTFVTRFDPSGCSLDVGVWARTRLSRACSVTLDLCFWTGVTSFLVCVWLCSHFGIFLRISFTLPLRAPFICHVTM